MPELKPSDCHYYEPDIKDFDWCPVISGYEMMHQSVCKKCHHNPEDGTREVSDGEL